MWGQDVYDVTLLGAAAQINKSKETKKSAKGGPPELIYALTSHQPRADIANLIQASAAILSQSKTIFFGKVLCMLRHYDPKMVELLYTGNYICTDSYFACLITCSRHNLLDTDSVILGIAQPDLSQLVKPEFAARRNELEDFLFENPHSKFEQSGYFKVY